MGGVEIAVRVLVTVAGALTAAVGLGGAASAVGLAAAVGARSFPLHASRDKITRNEPMAKLNLTREMPLVSRNLARR